MSNFVATIEKIEREDYQVELEADGVCEALDAARQMVELRNKKGSAKYHVIKIEQKEEQS